MPSGALGPAGDRHASTILKTELIVGSAPVVPTMQLAPSMRLTPADRLRKRFEFRRLRDQGRRVHTRSFVLLIARSEHASSRLGITVSRKVGNAVQRNRVKRLLREAFRQERSLFPRAADVVVIAKAGCAPLRLRDVQQELGQVRAALHAAWSKAPRHVDGRRP